MKFLFASDSFKGSLSSAQTAAILEREARLCFPDCECLSLPVADGGEGTLEAVLQASGGILVRKEVQDPLGRTVPASYAVLDGGRAFIEMAEASGLPLLTQEERNPLLTGTYGTGQLIRDALEHGCSQITVAIGGSATNDGGLGAALAVFLDAEMKPGIEAVLELIDFDRKLQGVDLVITGEGRMDWQSCFGKVPSGVGEHCKRLGIPAVAVVGGMGEGAETIYEHGILSIIPTVNGAMDVDEAIKRAEELYAGAARRMFRLLKVGTYIKTA